MRKYYKTQFYCEGFGHVDGSRITGFIHKCRKAVLQYCFCCMKDIVKGDQYIDFYSPMMGKERCHLECYSFYSEDEDKGNWFAVSRKTNGTYIVKKFINATETIDPKILHGTYC